MFCQEGSLFSVCRSFTFIIVRIQNQIVDPHELLYLFGHRVKGFAAYLRFAAGDAEDALRPRVIGNVPGYPAAVGKQGAALIGGVKGVPAYVIVGAVGRRSEVFSVLLISMGCKSALQMKQGVLSSSSASSTPERAYRDSSSL